MKRKGRAQSSSLFLMELILAILFFTIAAAVCVQLFVKSHVFSRQAQQLNHGVSECSGIAEIVNTSDSLEACLDTMADQYPLAMIGPEDAGYKATIYYDENFDMSEAEDASYALQVALIEEDHMMKVMQSFDDLTSESPDAIYVLDVQHYLQGGLADE